MINPFNIFYRHIRIKKFMEYNRAIERLEKEDGCLTVPCTDCMHRDVINEHYSYCTRCYYIDKMCILFDKLYPNNNEIYFYHKVNMVKGEYNK